MNTYLPSNGLDLWHIAGWTMIHFLWLGTLVALAALVCRLVLRRAPANIRYAAALTCLTLLAALPATIVIWLGTNGKPAPLASPATPNHSPTTAAPIIELSNHTDSVPTSARISSPPSAPGHGSAVAGSAGGFSGTHDGSSTAPSAPTTTNPRQSRGLPELKSQFTLATAFDQLTTCIPYLPWLWLIGTPITFALTTTGLIGTRRLRRASRPIIDGPITEALEKLAASLRVTRRITVAVCDRIASPVLIGILRPIILLPPAALTGYSPDEIEMVLLHELAHVRRWDNLVNLIQRLSESLLFFHPAVWLISSWVRRERETCCDAVVVTRTQQPHAYAELLLNIAAQIEPSPPGRGQGEGALATARQLAPYTTASAMAAGPLRSRIRRILKLDDDPMLVSGKSITVLLVGLLAAAMMIGLYLPADTHAEPSKGGSQQNDDAITPPPAEFAHKVQFEKGASKFMDGDAITIDEIRGTAKTFEPGNRYWIKGTYRLKSHDRAQISAFTTSANAEEGTGPIQTEQTKKIKGGEGTFTLILPMSVRGWPHVSFYPADGGDGFGGIYFGIGDSVLKKWWGSDDPESAGAAERTRFQGFEQSLKSVKVVVALFNDKNGFSSALNETHKQLAERERSLYTYGLKVDPSWEEAKRFKLTAAPTCIVFRNGHEVARLAPIQSARGLQEFVTHAVNQDTTATSRPLNFEIKASSDGDDHATLILNHEVIDDASIRRLIAAHVGFLDDIPVSLTAEKGVGYGAVMREVNRLEALGIKKFALAPKASGQPSASKFPSLEDQKLADLAYKCLSLELEPIGDADLKRVKALGYDGGVKVVAGTSGIDFAGTKIQPNDILVGLHAWPTANMKDLAQILNRNDLAELNPLKFYVVRDGNIQNANEPPTTGDIVVTGRVSVQIGGGFGSGKTSSYPTPSSPRQSFDSSTTKPRPSVAEELAPTTNSPYRDLSRPPRPGTQPAPNPQIPRVNIAPRSTPPTTAAEPAPANTPTLRPVAPQATPSLFVTYDIPPELKQKIFQYFDKCQRDVRIMPDDRGRYIVQATQAWHDNFAALLKAAPKWDDPAAAKERAANPVVMERIGDEDILEWRSIGLSFKRNTEPRSYSAVDRKGVAVAVVTPGSPAAWADVRPGDVLIEIGRFKAGTMKEVQSLLKALGEGLQSKKRIAVKFYRQMPNGSTFVDADFTLGPEDLGANPANDSKPLASTEASPAQHPPTRYDDDKAAAEFPYRVDFALGDSNFSKDDEIKILEIRGTAKTFEPGNKYRIKGTFKLASHDRAQLSAFVTARKAAEGHSSMEDMQTAIIARGEGDFTLVLPMTYKGWPHVSFYPAGGGNGFGGIYFGTGDSVLKRSAKLSHPAREINANEKSALRYDGKTFDEWQNAWRTELSTEKRLEAVNALAAFGANGYGREATEAILEVAGQYDWTQPTSNDSLISLKKACLDAFGGTGGSSKLSKSDALPVLLRDSHSTNKAVRQFVAAALRSYARADEAAMEALLELSRDDDKAVRTIAWEALRRVYSPGSPAAQKAVHEALASNYTDSQIAALKAIWNYDLTKAAPQASNPEITNMPELFSLLFSNDREVRRYARRTLERLKHEDSTGVADKLLAVLKDDSKKEQHIEAIRGLAALGWSAKSAVDTLRPLVKSDDQPLAIAAAAALKRILKQAEYSKLLVEQLGDRLNLQMQGDFLQLPAGEKRQEFHAFERAVQAEEKQLFP